MASVGGDGAARNQLRFGEKEISRWPLVVTSWVLLDLESIVKDLDCLALVGTFKTVNI